MQIKPTIAKSSEGSCDHTVSLKTGKRSNFNYKVVVRPHVTKLLNTLKKYFDLVIYSTDFCANLNTLAKLLEQNSKYFSFLLGKEHMKDSKFKLRNLELLETLGINKK